MSEHDFKLNVGSLIARLLEGMCLHLLICSFILSGKVNAHQTVKVLLTRSQHKCNGPSRTG